MHDIIGDIHGLAQELVELLELLGYSKHRGVYQHPERQAIFLGDFIDRGPQIRETLEIVRPMIDSGEAFAVMGNHELNALAFHTPDPDQPGEYLRQHTPAKIKQHAETIGQLFPGQLQSYLTWFRTLPLWLELDGLRVVHACWDENQMARIPGSHSPDITDEFLYLACKTGKELYAPVEVILKGKEAPLPDGFTFMDKAGQEKTDMRVKWYQPAEGQTYRTYGLNREEISCDELLSPAVMKSALPYPQDAKPVFIGHYLLSAARPYVLADNVACVDWGFGKTGFLCAYRWDGEQKLDNEKFVRSG